MISTIDRDFVVKNGVASFPMKEYPDWYGIPNVGFIWHNSWSDPEIEYNRKKINSYIVEDTMWERFKEEHGEHADEDLFDQYMRDNADEVYYLIELAIGENIL